MFLSTALIYGLATTTSLQGAGATATAPVELLRKWTAGEKLTYVTKAQFTDEQRIGDLQTFIPTDQDITYRHTLHVQKVKADGIAEVLFDRPNMTIIIGDTGSSSAKSLVEKTDINQLLDISPTNKVLNVKNVDNKKEKKGGLNDLNLLRKSQGDLADLITQKFLVDFVQDFQRLAFFVGSGESGLDVSPVMPFEEVKVGDTWKATATYQPQKLKGQGDKQAVQRLDFTYTYLGLMKSKEGKDIQRIQAKVDFTNDMVDYARQVVGASRSSMQVKSAPIKFNAMINFDLDPSTLHLVKAVAESQGSFSFSLKGIDQPYVEDRFKGRTVVKLENWAKANVKAPNAPASAAKKTNTKKSGGGL
jgi:hypothetical protein